MSENGISIGKTFFHFMFHPKNPEKNNQTNWWRSELRRIEVWRFSSKKLHIWSEGSSTDHLIYWSCNLIERLVLSSALRYKISQIWIICTNVMPTWRFRFFTKNWANWSHIFVFVVPNPSKIWQFNFIHHRQLLVSHLYFSLFTDEQMMGNWKLFQLSINLSYDQFFKTLIDANQSYSCGYLLICPYKECCWFYVKQSIQKRVQTNYCRN